MVTVEVCTRVYSVTTVWTTLLLGTFGCVYLANSALLYIPVTLA